MNTHRRGLLAGLGLTALAGATSAVAQTSAPASPPKPPFADRLAARAAEHRLPVTFANGSASGPGVDRLIEEGRKARFFLLGEEHGLQQVPALVGTVLPALKDAGYARLGLEVSPPGAGALDTAAAGGVDGLKRFYADHRPGPAFYTMKQETQMLAAVRGAFPGKAPLLFGLDYEVTQDRLLVDLLAPKVPTSARSAFAALRAAFDAAWAEYETTRNISVIPSFSGDPALVRAVRAAWRKPDAASDDILETLEQTLVINGHQTAGRYFQSNESRAQFNRANWARFWRTEGAKARPPHVFFKFGAGHMMRGRSPTEVYDIGNMVSETAALRGESSFHLLVVPMAGGTQAALNPETLDYQPVPVSTIEEMALEPLVKAALPGSSTLIDLRPLRLMMSGSVTQTADPRLSRVVHGFDMLLLVDGAVASENA
jgi:hypothetical protein